MRVVFDDFGLGDVRVVGVRLTPRQTFALPSCPPVSVTSGSWALVQAQTGAPVNGAVSPGSGNFLVKTAPPYSFLTTDPIAWLATGSYVMRCDLLWSDGTQDNTLCLFLNVKTPCT